jgi:hypothetical protein
MQRRTGGARWLAGLVSVAAGLVLALACAAGARGDGAAPAGGGGGICDGCTPPTACEDGRDNDGDAKIDYPVDPGCTDPGDPDETDPGAVPPPPPPPGGSAQCSDGSDNDADGLVDLDDITGCSGPDDPDEGDDVYDPGESGYEFFRYDEPGNLDTRGLCAWLGAYRDRHGIRGRLWKFNVVAHFCWNGRFVSRIDNVQRWIETAGFPINVAFPVSWRMEIETQGAVGLTVTTIFHQANVKVCPIKLPRCLTDEHPWIRFILFGTGSALCQTDTGPVASADCRRVG